MRWLGELHLSFKFINSSRICWSSILRTLKIFFIQKIKFDSTQTVRKYCKFLLKFDHLLYSHFPASESRNVEKLTKFHNFKPWRCKNSCNKCLEVVHWLKNMFIFCGNFRLFWVFQITLFHCRGKIHVITYCVNLPLCFLKSDMNLCKFNVHSFGKLFFLLIDALTVLYILLF